jgi:spore cortex biosynthesis protein YabQ
LSATINQPYIFLATVYGGLLIGLLYGLVTVIRRLTHAGKWATLLWDIFFFAAATLICLIAVYIANKADLRFYTFAGLAAGFLLYFFGIRLTVVLICRKMKLCGNKQPPYKVANPKKM